mmetsp:Transcript_430/g.813  ORF Transcript_430/g.813 Transcript_430/m.813 type:complete len:94 (-) Transcript_430:233-514(-)
MTRYLNLTRIARRRPFHRTFQSIARKDTKAVTAGPQGDLRSMQRPSAAVLRRGQQPAQQAAVPSSCSGLFSEKYNRHEEKFLNMDAIQMHVAR